jgi:NAD-dependent dihydropyrimidine dehydrogenase PreA subunit
MKVKRKIIEIDEERCDGCGSCVPACAEGAIQIIDGKAKVISDKFCDGLGACLGECPQDALRIIEREAEEFDEEAVQTNLDSVKEALAQEAQPPACGCPSARVQELGHSDRDVSNQSIPQRSPGESSLTHWPIQISLVPPDAPFLRGADLLVAADCTPVAYPTFHQDFLKGKVVLLGCPKLDDAEAYAQKFAEIFRKADIRSITVLVMEVPCCQGLPSIVAKGMKEAGKEIPLELIVISAKGAVLDSRCWGQKLRA